jgi:ankyrin repeat protein
MKNLTTNTTKHTTINQSNQKVKMSTSFWKSLTAEINQMFDKQNFIEPKKINNQFIKACKTGNLEMVNACLASGVDPSANDNSAIRWASFNGHISVVDRLLQDKRVDPSVNDNSSIRMASENGHISVVDRLLQDKRVDPSAVNKSSTE